MASTIPGAVQTGTVTIANTTAIGQGNVIVNAGGPSGPTLRLQNRVLVGEPYFNDTAYNTADAYAEGGVTMTEANSVKQGLRNSVCNATGTYCVNAGLANASIALGSDGITSVFDPHLTSTSQAINRASYLTLVTNASIMNLLAKDYQQNARSSDAAAKFDAGALMR